MRTLMYAVGKPVVGSRWRKMCISFRPKKSSDQEYLRIVYGNGCSATVINYYLMTDLSFFLYR
jgi:hypothetical protein